MRRLMRKRLLKQLKIYFQRYEKICLSIFGLCYSRSLRIRSFFYFAADAS